MFRDRHDAGRKLAAALSSWIGESPVVLALPRGGVPVAYEVAVALKAPLDLLLVRKIGLPFAEEVALGAVVDGGEIFIDRDMQTAHGVSQRYVDEEIARQFKEIERRRERYLAGKKPTLLTGRNVIIIDDGIATGATMRVAVRAVRKQKPASIVLAVPVAPPDALEDVGSGVDKIVCLHSPPMFGAVGRFYEDFHQLEDAEVTLLMERAARVTGRDQ
jgi:putative phosphoribosyl transferase